MGVCGREEPEEDLEEGAQHLTICFIRMIFAPRVCVFLCGCVMQAWESVFNPYGMSLLNPQHVTMHIFSVHTLYLFVSENPDVISFCLAVIHPCDPPSLGLHYITVLFITLLIVYPPWCD